MLDVDKAYTGEVMTIIGNVGNGKNTLAVALCRVMLRTCIHGVKLEYKCTYCKKYEIKQEDRKSMIIANFPIDLPDTEFIPIPTIENFIALHPIGEKEPTPKQHSICIIDEPNSWGFDSHGSAFDKRADKAGYKVQHTRKYNRDIIFLTQLWSMVNLRGKRLSSNTIFAVEPTSREFRYGWYKRDAIIPLTIRKSYARKSIFPYFRSDYRIGEEQLLDVQNNPSELSIVN